MPLIQHSLVPTSPRRFLEDLDSNLSVAYVTINVKDPQFSGGAKGDGVTDDTAAIQAALNFASIFAGAQGMAVKLPRGDYTYTTLNINASHVKFLADFDARLIKRTTTGDGLTVKGLAGRIFGVQVRGIFFANQTPASAGRQVYFENVGQCKVDGCTVTNFPAAPFQGMEFYNVSQSTVDVDIQNCLNIGFRARDCVDLTPKPGSRCDANGSHGWEFDTCSGVYPSSVTAWNNGGRGFNLLSTIGSPVLATAGSSFHFYSSCVADFNASDNWNMTGLISSEFSACWGASQSGVVADRHGFLVDACVGVEFSGCVALTNNGAGMRVTNASNGITIRGGRYNNNGKQSGSAIRTGVSFGTTVDVTMIGVEMTDRQGVKSQTFGIGTTATASRLEMSGCDMRGNLTGPHSFSALPTIFSEEQNITGESQSIASANVITLSPFGKRFTVTGTTNINGLATGYNNRQVTLMFAGVLTVGDTGSLVLAGNFVTAANSVLRLEHDGTNWLECSRSIN